MVAHDKTAQAVAQYIGADGLVYQYLDDVMASINQAAKKDADKKNRFEDSIFSGKYITGEIDKHYLSTWADERAQSALCSENAIES